MTGRLRPVAAGALLVLLSACGASGPGNAERTEVPGQAPPTTAATGSTPDAPTTCTGKPDDPAACSESDGRRLPDSR